MALLTKKFRVVNPSNNNYTDCEMYTTIEEAGAAYFDVIDSGNTHYVALVPPADDRATVMQIVKNGTTYRIGKNGIIPYTEKYWGSPGTYSFTVPGGVYKMRVAVCGGGGGTTTSDARAGTSTFGGLISATGGSNAWKIVNDDDADASEAHSGSGGSPNSKADGTGWALSFSGSSGDYGVGGYVTLNSRVYNEEEGNYSEVTNYYYAGSGGYNSGYISVTAGDTYSVTVGAARSGGSDGFVYIAYGGDIR